MEFVRVNYDNNKVSCAELTSHREVIEEYASKGYKYLGFVPVKLGPSGKMLALDLVFDNK
ncbi:MAG: DUF4177 domain-containing protein [Ruminococcus sp.]|nr:DUF4177 domain-containing protein [Ruminococcus sp.]MDY3896253.1 DUF4177 domain-containing protein [Candidatus Fimenecus sp.]